jgi:hypothetical protein
MSYDLRSQLDVVAHLNERTTTESIRIALEAWIERSKNDPTVLARAEPVRADIEREARMKRSAIAASVAAGAATKARSSKREGS